MNEKLLIYTAEQVTKEREAWARLVKAEVAEARREEWYAPHYTQEIDAARQALRDLGVDVDLLMK